MRILSRVLAVTLGILATVSVAPAQQAPLNGPANPRRAMLEQQLRQRTALIVKQRLGLTDAQMTRLQAANKQFEAQRAPMLMREREVRRELRQQIMSGDSANQTRVSQLLDEAMVLERNRLDLQQQEQRELAKFMTPVQRAKYFAVQAELRKKAQEIRARTMQGGVAGDSARRGPRFN